MPYLTVYGELPDPDVLLQLAPEELAGVVIRILNARIDHDKQNALHIHVNNFANEINQYGGGSNYPQRRVGEIQGALMEAWGWLVSNGLLTLHPESGKDGVFIVTRRGRELRNDQQFEDFRKASAFPRSLVHRKIADQAWIDFVRGRYDTAVFNAFKEIEIAVRTAGKYGANDIGVSLIRLAFNKSNGPLTDMSLPDAEREALSNLFAGAIGSYKNPHSHRAVAMTDPTEAMEMIILASHLYRIVEARAAKIGVVL